MKDIVILPDKRFKTKTVWMFLTISAFVLLVIVLLQFLVPLSPKTNAAEVAIIVWPIFMGVLILLWILIFPLTLLWINSLSFYIMDDKVAIKKGFISKITQNIPFRAVTDFQLHRSLYDRMLGLGSIKIQTAGQMPGGAGYEGVLYGLTDWNGLHDELQNRLRDRSSVTNVEPRSGEGAPAGIPEIYAEVKKIRELLERR